MSLPEPAEIVVAAEADESVIAAAAVEVIVAAQTGERVGSGATDQNVVVVPVRVGEGRRPAGGRVADEQIVARTTVDEVVAFIATYDVVTADRL